MNKKLKRLLTHELRELRAPEVLCSFYNGEATFSITDMDIEPDEITLYVDYWRKYYQAEATLKSGAVAGWSRTNKHEHGVYMIVTIGFICDQGPETIVDVESMYRGQEAKNIFIVTDDEVVALPSYSEIESQTVARAADAIAELIRTKLEKILDGVIA